MSKVQPNSLTSFTYDHVESQHKPKTKPIIISRATHPENSIVSSSVPSTSKSAHSQRSSNLDRLFSHSKRFRSRSLDQYPRADLAKKNPLFKKKRQNKKSQVVKERFFYDPRFNKTPEHLQQFVEGLSDSDSVSSHTSSHDSNISSNSSSFFSKLQWPPKFLTSKSK